MKSYKYYLTRHDWYLFLIKHEIHKESLAEKVTGYVLMHANDMKFKFMTISRLVINYSVIIT